MTTNQVANQAVPFGAGEMFIKQVRNAAGEALPVPQSLRIPDVQSIDFEDKGDLKPLHGKDSYAIALGGGKKTTSVKITMASVYAKLLNEMYYGKEVAQGADLLYTDRKGVMIPEGRSVNVKIANLSTFFLGKWAAHTGATIDGITATRITDASAVLVSTALVKQFRCSGGEYTFAKEDIGKNAVITMAVVGGVTVVTTLKIPKTLRWDSNQFNWVNSVKKGFATWTKDVYGTATIAPAAGHYQCSPSGVLKFNSADTGPITIEHKTHGILVSTVVATLPAAAYRTIIDPPGSLTFSDAGAVTLATDTGTAMTGVAAGGPLTQSATPTTGQFNVDSAGIYTFAAADLDDVVNIIYHTGGYETITVVPPTEGDFIEDRGVLNESGLPMTRVALTSPVALSLNQYAVTATGDYFFDATNRGEKAYISYKYHTATGTTVVNDNAQMGSGPTLEIDIQHEYDGNIRTISGMLSKPKGTGIKSKQDDWAPIDVEFEVFCDPITRVVYTLSTNSI